LDQSWKYSKAFSPSAPVIALELAGLKLECVVDTGFSGGLMIPFPIFESLGLLSRLVPDEYQAIMPDSRRVSVYTTRDYVVAGSSRIRTLIHASPRLERRLLGRAFLESFVTTLDGPHEVLSVSGHLPA
jgi:clan AA aspartic protease